MIYVGKLIISFKFLCCFSLSQKQVPNKSLHIYAHMLETILRRSTIFGQINISEIAGEHHSFIESPELGNVLAQQLK